MNASQTTGPRIEELMDAGDETDQPPSPGARPRRPGLTLEVHDETERLSEADLARFRSDLARAVAVAAPAGDHDVRVLIASDETMIDLHRRHSGDASTTDVLTFDLRAEPEGPLDVDLVVCLDEARRAASARPHNEVDELILYSLHGVLHCLGYNDHDEDAYRRMHAREDEILTAIGLGNLFRDNDA
jgi:probable rRNA maturation factor